MTMKSSLFKLLAASAVLAGESFTDYNQKLGKVITGYTPPASCTTRGKFIYKVRGIEIEAESMKDAKRIYSRKYKNA